MLEKLKKGAIGFVLKVKDLFTSSESKIYVKDLRKVMMHDGRKCQYPKNYDQIVKSGKITEERDSNGKLVKDEEGNPRYQLEYNGCKFSLDLVRKIDEKSYFTIDFLANQKKNKDIKRYGDYYKTFDFSKLDLKKCLPVFEAEKTENSQYSFKLTNSSVLTKEKKDKKGKVQEVIDEKGRNGELLYTSNYKKLNTHFSEIRDQNDNLELDKSLISVPIVFITSLAKICAKLLTFIPMKLGENLIGKQNLIAKSFGYLLFTPAMTVKNLVNIGATIFKSPILLFVANEKKYGDAYLTMWKHQLKGCWGEAKNDFSVIEDGKRLKPGKKNYPECDPCGTWKELDVRRPDIEKGLEKALSEGNKNIIKLGDGENFNKSSETYSEKEQNRRNSQQARGRTPL